MSNHLLSKVFRLLDSMKPFSANDWIIFKNDRGIPVRTGLVKACQKVSCFSVSTSFRAFNASNSSPELSGRGWGEEGQFMILSHDGEEQVSVVF